MSKQPAGSRRDTTELAKRYSENRSWQHERGLLLLGITAPSESEKVLEFSRGTGELTTELARRVGCTGPRHCN